MKNMVGMLLYSFILCCCLNQLNAFHIKFTTLGDEEPITNESENQDDFFDHFFKGIRHIIEDHQISEHENDENNKTSYNVSTSSSSALSEIKTKITELPNGVQKIEKLVEKESEFFKYPNKTIKKIDHIKDNGTETKKESVVECIDSLDCNSTSYCDKLSYSCKTCHAQEETCSTSAECCSGFMCDIDTKRCKRKTGMTGDPCLSVSECSSNHCCAMNANGHGVCQPYLTEGEDCSSDPFMSMLSNPFLQETTSGLPSKCPCKDGFKCQPQSSLFFLTNEVCSKPNENKRNMVKIHIKRIPTLQYHGEEDEENFPLPMFPEEIRPKNHRMSIHPLNRHNIFDHPAERDELISKHGAGPHLHRRKTPAKKHTQLSPLFPFINIMKPFGGMLDSLGGDEEDIMDDVMRSKKHKLKRNQRNKRELVEDVSESAREAVHDAVDGIFDSIMKGVIEAMKYRE